MDDLKNRPIGQLSYIEQCQMDEIVKLKSIISHLLAIIECYRRDIPKPGIIGDTPTFKHEIYNQGEGNIKNENI